MSAVECGTKAVKLTDDQKKSVRELLLDYVRFTAYCRNEEDRERLASLLTEVVTAYAEGDSNKVWQLDGKEWLTEELIEEWDQRTDCLYSIACMVDGNGCSFCGCKEVDSRGLTKICFECHGCEGCCSCEKGD